MRAAIVDTGPLVAFLDRAEKHHRWVAERIEELDTPLLVCEPVLAEAMHLLARDRRLIPRAPPKAWPAHRSQDERAWWRQPGIGPINAA